VPNVIVL